MPHPDDRSLWSSSSAAGRLADRALWGAGASVTLGELVRGSSLGGRLEELRGRSVLIATSDQLTAALALVELDGVARRLVLGPPDLPSEHLSHIVTTAAVDALVSDGAVPPTSAPGVGVVVPCRPRLAPTDVERPGRPPTAGLPLKFATTSPPKVVVPPLATLA